MFDFDHYLPLGWQEEGMVMRISPRAVPKGRVARRGGVGWQAALVAPIALTFAIATTHITIAGSSTSSLAHKVSHEGAALANDEGFGPWVGRDFWTRVEDRFENAVRISEPDFSDDAPLI